MSKFDLIQEYNPYKKNISGVNAEIQKLLAIMAEESPGSERYQQAQEVLNYAMSVRSDVTEKSNLFPVQICIFIVVILFIMIFGIKG